MQKWFSQTGGLCGVLPPTTQRKGRGWGTQAADQPFGVTGRPSLIFLRYVISTCTAHNADKARRAITATRMIRLMSERLYGSNCCLGNGSHNEN